MPILLVPWLVCQYARSCQPSTLVVSTSKQHYSRTPSGSKLFLRQGSRSSKRSNPGGYISASILHRAAKLHLKISSILSLSAFTTRVSLVPALISFLNSLREHGSDRSVVLFHLDLHVWGEAVNALSVLHAPFKLAIQLRTAPHRNHARSSKAHLLVGQGGSLYRALP